MIDKPLLAARLRQATKAAHHRLDHHPLLAALLDPTVDRQRYGDALSALHGVFAAAENLVARQATADFPHHPRTPALEADLAELGRTPLPFTGHIPAPEVAGARIGLLYVVEGSTLGGQMLARQLRTALGTNCPLRFFAGTGETATANRWSGFWHYATACCAPADFPAAEAAATGLFAAFSQHLDACLSRRDEQAAHAPDCTSKGPLWPL